MSGRPRWTLTAASASALSKMPRSQNTSPRASFSWCLFAFVVVVALWHVPRAQAVSAAQAVANLNAQRAANGIPAGISENPSWSAACALHNKYEQLNGGVLTHGENPDNPGYTDEGNWAGGNSVLSMGSDWSSANPWESAPIHLNQLLAPRLNDMGVDDTNGYTCATTLAGRARPPPTSDVVYTYPGNNTTGIYSDEVASEGPFTPGELIGIPQGTTTGPYLLVFVDGPTLDVYSDARINQASLAGPDGAVEVKTVDNYTPGLTGYLPPGGEIIPISPLRVRSPYHAHVAGTVGSVSFNYDWSFTTGAKRPNGRIDVNENYVSFYSQSLAQGTLTATRPATGASTEPQPIDPDGSVTLDISPGVWRACVHQPMSGDYDPWDGCEDTSITTLPRLSLSRPRVRGRNLVFTLTVSKVLLNQTLTVTTRKKKKKRKPSTRNLTVRKAKSLLRVRRPRKTVRVSVRSPSVQVGDVTYRARSVQRVYRPRKTRQRR